MGFSRREFLNKGFLGVGATIYSSNSWASATTKLFFKNDEPNIIIELTAKQNLIDIGNGLKTKLLIFFYQSPYSTFSSIKPLDGAL